MLLSNSEAPNIVGQYIALCRRYPKESADFIRECFSIVGDLERKVDDCIRGFLISVDAEVRIEILSTVLNGADANQTVRLFRCAPLGQDTWRLLDHYDEEVRNRYWKEVFPYWNRQSDAEIIEIIDRLLEVQRPRAAFHIARMDWSQIETSRIKRLLQAAATSNVEAMGSFQLQAYAISAALSSLDGRAGVSPEEMAQLEFLFITALEHSEHGIPNLERQIAESPLIFVQAVALAYKRSDDLQDPPEWRIDDPDRRTAAAFSAHQLLDQIRRIPGTNHNGKINEEALLALLTEVRRFCTQYSRSEIGDQSIGQLLSKAPAEENGVWPCLSVCEAMERIASQQIAAGFRIGVYNARGAHWRDEGGTQERELAERYRCWAQQLSFDYPYVGSVIESIAATYDWEADRHDSEAKVRKRLKD
jgi:hypothetical protein